MNIFDRILVKRPKRSLFNLSHEVKLTGNMGWLYPILCQEVIPGDTWKINSEVLCRFAPLTAPIMHRVNLKMNYFFVPMRLIWDEWETFITGGEDGKHFPVKPYFEANKLLLETKLKQGTLFDHLGFPTVDETNPAGQSTVYKFDVLPFRAYSLIWNEYFRNQNLQAEVPVAKTSGKDTITNFDLLRRCWEKDYFTSALPFVQRGDPVKIPIGSAGIEISGTGNIVVQSGELVNLDKETTDELMAHSSGGDWHFVSGEHGSSSDYYDNGDSLAVQGEVSASDIASKLFGEIDTLDGTINDLRTAYRLQRWLENNARAGSRYIEQILSHFGVKSSDARLQRPEYLGGYSTPIIISEVLQNSGVQIDAQGDPVGTPQGNMAGKGMAVDKSHYVKRYFEEHGYVIGLLSVLPRTTYQQGLPRQYQRNDRYDYYFPEFANLGEQDIRNNEVYFNFTTPSGDTTTFGYQQRYSEYRYIPSSVHGDFRNSLRFWHLGRFFRVAPALNAEFVKADVSDRVFAVDDPTIDKLWIEVYNNIRAVRPMPKFAIPS